MPKLRQFLEGEGMTIGKTGLRIEPTLTVGNLMNAVPLLVMLVGIAWWGLSYASRTDDTRQKLTDLQAEVRSQLKELKDATTDNLKIIQQQIANLPTQAARLQQAERAIEDLRHADRDLDGRLGAVERMSVESRERINRLDRPDIPVRQTR